MGADGVRDIDLSVLDPSGAALGHDTTHAPQASVRACGQVPGTYTLVVKMAAGSGDFVTGLWSGGFGSAAASAPVLVTGEGTCDSPYVLTAGSVTGTNAKGSEDSEGDDDCSRSRGKEIVYRLDLPSRKRVIIDVEGRFDSLVYVRRDSCEDGEQVACNDDAQNSKARQPPSHLDAVLDPGVYWVFVDSSGDTGSYRLTAQLLDVPTLADACRMARPLGLGPAATGTTHDSFNHARASCGDDAKGRDVVYRFDLGQRSRVRITEHADDFAPIVHVRKSCVDEQSEIACYDTSGRDSEAAFVATLDPGQYWVFADSSDEDADGRYSLGAEVAPEQGTGVAGDACVDAVPLTKSDPDVSGDTFDAKDDVAGKCGGSGAPDVVYRIDVARRSRVTASFNAQDGEHVFLLTKSCADKALEIACSTDRIDQTLNAGTYYLAVDGAQPGSFGRFSFDFRIKDIALQEAACKTPPELKANTTVSGNTTGAGDKFYSGCSGREDAAASGDRVYQVTVAKKSMVRFVLSSPTFDSVLSLRRTCADPPGASSGRASEITCSRGIDDGTGRHARIETVLDPGTYFLDVDGMLQGNEGPFTLEYKVVQVLP
jgi:hypothetical protein